ncbi:MAG: AAA family ATPase [Bacilli bacterium]|nr:AAA family ATPase [Bacilli bacterium]
MMYLKEIQTYGFKSFADKINFEFTNNINGIVGPNGSGKSNVVDAVRWVLGEQSNKSLRASDNISVIFSGSKSRKPLNSAMVNIIFDNTDRHLPIDFNEVSIKRVLYRTGDNEYYLNGEKCRLKDITELLTDSGAAKESFNIIGQGKIDEILTTKANERRIIFEEAAGVLKYKKRKEEAIRKLERTNTNINRINDIINELENNLTPLEIQSKAAKAYLDTKEKLTNYDISLMIYDVDNYSNEYNLCKEEVVSLSDKISELNKNNAGYDISILEYKDKINKLELLLTNNNQKVLELIKQLEQTDADLRILRERKKYINSDINIDKINNIKENILINKNNLTNLSKDIDNYNKQISDIDNNINNYQEKVNIIKNKIFKYNDNISKNERDITSLKYQINYLEDVINNGGNIPNSVKNLLHNPLFSGVYGTIGSLINVSSEYSLAISTSLGGASNYLVVNDSKLASDMVNYLKDKKLGRATFYPLDVIRPRYIDNETLAKLSLCNGYINTLDRIVNYNDKYQNIILNQLGNVILVDTIENANKISKVINNKYKIVTLDGQIVNVGGSITGGEKIKSNDLIQQKHELSENKRRLEILTDNNKNILIELSNLNKELSKYQDLIQSKNIDKINYIEIVNNKGLSKDKLDISLKELEKELSDILVITGNDTENEESNLMNKYYQLKEEIDIVNKDIEILKIEKNKINQDLFEIEESSKNSNQYISKLEGKLHDNDVKISKLEVHIDNILNSLNEDYSITYNEARDKYILEDDPDKIRKEVISLKNKLKDYGLVNLGAIEEYERVSKRYEFLISQRDDLNKAENTLLEIIGDMDNIMKEKFVKTFEDIRKEFKIVFRELFKGGNADIYMTEPDNVLETGIELEATPPGKNLKSIQALSGGEKTFTAISLLFAILNVRPVPFCLFDEVEAALDDANVDAFGEYLDKYRNKTQFIIITHKKKTMEFIDTLYGITMQESGVSKKVSVKLNDFDKK